MKIDIRSAEPNDAEAIRRVFDGPNAVAGTLQVPHASVESWRKLQSEQPAYARILEALVKGQIVSHLGLHPAARSRRAHVAAIGMGVSDRWERRGIGSALLRQAICLADNWLNILRLELTVYTDNEAGIRLYKKFGFVIEGTYRAAANGIERGAKAVAKGIEHGATATARGVEHGAKATGNAARRVANRMGKSPAPSPTPDK